MAAEKSMNFLLLCGIPISVGLIVAAPNIIGFLYHRAEFEHAVPVMQLLAPGLVFLYINSVFGSIIISTRHEKNITIMAAIALVFNVGLNIIAIPRYEHIGAAAVTSLTELLLVCLAFVFVPRSLWPVGSVKVGVKALAAGMVMALAIWATRQMNLFVILPIAMVTYFATAALFGTIPREDLKALYTSIRNKAGHQVAHSPVEEGTELLSGEVILLTEEEMQPELDSAFAFRMELTDPVLPIYGSISDSPHTHRIENSTRDHEVAVSGEIALSAYEDTVPRKVMHKQTDTLKLKLPATLDAERNDTVRLRSYRPRSSFLKPRVTSNANGDDTVPLRLRRSRLIPLKPHTASREEV